MRQYESDGDLENEIKNNIEANIESLESHYGLGSTNSMQRLVEIILDPKKSQALFSDRRVSISSLFQKNGGEGEINPKHIALFSSKYSYERLVEKFPKPRGETNRVLLAILERKMSKEVINSHQTRKNLWMLVSGAKFAMMHHRGLYQQLVGFPHYPDHFLRAIQNDITRTVPRSQTTPEELKSLSNILTAFSRRNPYVGYCQGLNFVAYFLLTMQFEEEEAFWILSQVIETIIPMDYYTNMIGVVCDQQIFLYVLGKTHPAIVRKFNEVGLDPSVLSIEWFVCLFTSSLPFYLVKIVWDRLIIEGPRAFLKAGLIIMSHFEREILQVEEFHEIILLLEKGCKQLQIPQTQFNQRFQRIFVSRQGLILARVLYREYHLKEKLMEKEPKRNRLSEVECDPAWPICTLSLERNKKERKEIEVWIFRESKPPKLDHQYLEKKVKHHAEPFPSPPRLEQTGKIRKMTTSVASQEGSYEQFGGLRPIREETENSMNVTQKLESLANEVEVKQPQSPQSFDPKQLIIGRIHHVCGGKAAHQTENKLLKSSRKSLILPDDRSNKLKKSNIMRMIAEGEQAEQEEQDERTKRSQTIRFFSKFVSDNQDLSSVIVGISPEK